jgi:hypothetical protein
MHREILAEVITGERCVWVLLLQPYPLGTVADDDLASRPIHRQERLDILFHRDAADVGRNRPRQREKILGMGFEQMGVHTTAPICQILEAARRKFEAQRLRTHHAAHGGAVKPAQRPVGSAHRHRKPRAQILRELRVIRSRKAHSVTQTEPPGAKAERPFGCNVKRLRRKLKNAAFHSLVGQDRQTDFRVCRAADVVKVAGSNEPDFVPEPTKPCSRLSQSADHAVGLRKPRVGNDHDSHAGHNRIVG